MLSELFFPCKNIKFKECFLGTPSSIATIEPICESNLIIASNFENVKETTDEDVNKNLYSMFYDHEFQNICENSDKNGFLRYLVKKRFVDYSVKKGELPQKAGNSSVYTQVYLVISAGIAVAVGAVAAAIVLLEAEPEERSVAYRDDEIRNAIDRMAEIPTVKFLIWTGGVSMAICKCRFLAI